MAEGQKALFEDDHARSADSLALKPRARPRGKLTPAQKLFNRLTAQVEDLRARLEEETQELNDALAYYGKHLRPREERGTALRKEIVRLLASFLDSRQIQNKKDRKALREVIAEQLEMVMQEGGPLEDADLRELFERVYDASYEEVAQQEVNELRSHMEAMFAEMGVDYDLSDIRPDMTPEEMAKKMAEMTDEVTQKLRQNENNPPRQGRKTKRQLEQEERTRLAEVARQKGIATLYKQLAKVLHPDLEQDEARRQAKVVLMQELTTAYRRNDLHTLLRLELEWIHQEEGNIERLTDEKLGIYNQVLREQVTDLKMEIEGLALHPKYSPILSMDEFGFGFEALTDGPAEASLLDDMIREMETSLAELRSNRAENEVRAILKKHRAAVRESKRLEEDWPF